MQQSIGMDASVVSVGRELQEIPDTWEKLTSQSTLQSPQVDLYSVQENTWAVVSTEHLFGQNRSKYVIEDLFESFTVNVPTESYPKSLQNVELPAHSAVVLEDGFTEMVSLLATIWLEQPSLVNVKEARYNGNQLTLTVNNTVLHYIAKGLYCGQILQAAADHPDQSERLCELTDEIKEMDTYHVEITTETLDSPEDYALH